MTSLPPRRPVTVVVPLYDDLPGIEACLASLAENVDFAVDRVLLTNDAGPLADEIEARVGELVGDHDGFSYHRNPRNLGFVGNCNQAVLELDSTGNDVLLLNSDTVTTRGFIDELAAVLSLSPDHGIVTARSNNATIASLPHRLRDAGSPRSPSRTRRTHAAVAAFLPRFTVAPVAMGFCYLVRRELIDQYGFFDETFAPGYGEENDFCLRVGLDGHSSVLANRALVFHVGSTSFSSDLAPRLRFGHEKILVERYPFYVAAQQRFFHRDRDPVDTFADVFAPEDDAVRVAVTSPTTARPDWDALSLALANMGPGMECTLVLPRRWTRRARRRFRGVSVTDRARTRAVFDVAVHVGQLDDVPAALALNDLSPRWLVVEGPEKVGISSEGARSSGDSPVHHVLEEFVDASPGRGDPRPLEVSITALSRARIDVERLRRRWNVVIELATEAGVITYPRRASVRRRAALAFASRWPQLADSTRKALGR